MDAHAETLDLDVIWRTLGICGLASINTFKTIVEDCESDACTCHIKIYCYDFTIYGNLLLKSDHDFFCKKASNISDEHVDTLLHFMERKQSISSLQLVLDNEVVTFKETNLFYIILKQTIQHRNDTTKKVTKIALKLPP